VLPVVIPEGEKIEITKEAYIGSGKIANSGFLDGLDSRSRQGILSSKNAKPDKTGFGTTQFRLRDWGVSSQRYWGCPIPMIHCAKCGVVPVPESDLPVTLAARRHLRQARQPA
jgi:leucyl-tRNA synthetase